MLFKSMPTPLHQKHKISLSAIAVAVVLAGVSNTVLAENSSTPKAMSKTDTRDIIHVSTSPYNLEKIAVAENVEVIDAQAPEQQAATSALDLLKGQPGVFVSGSNSTYGQSIQMRGYDSRGVKVTVDNITQDFNSGLYDATFIDPTLVKKVYIHKGSSSVHHGGGALAGVVSFKTLNATDILKPNQNLGGRIFSGIDHNEHSYYAGGTLFGRLNTLDTLISYSQRKKNLIGSPDFAHIDNHENIHNWMLKTTWAATPSYLLAIQLKDYHNESLGVKQPSKPTTKERYPNTPHERNSRQFDVAISQYFTPKNSVNWQAEWDIYYSDLSLDQTDTVKITTKPKEYGTERRNQYTYGTKFANSFTIPMYRWANHHIQSGVEYYAQQQKSNQYAISYPAASLTNTSGWLVNDMTLQHLPITFSAGTRFTRYQTDSTRIAKNAHTNWSSRFAVSATPQHWVNIFSSYSESYRTPRMSELYNNSNHFTIPFIGMKSDFRPSPELLPEVNKTIEAGVKLSFDDLLIARDSLHFGSTYFYTKAKDHIALEGEYEEIFNIRKFRTEHFPKELYFVNIPSATIRGFDSFIHYKTQWFELNLSHNLTQGNEDGSHYSLSSIRPETLVARFNAPVLETGVNIGWIGEFTGKTAFEGNVKYQLSHHKSDKDLDRYHKEVIQQAGYSLHDFYLNYQADQFIKGLSSTLTMKNAFDKQYVSSMGVPQEGRNFHLNVNYSW